MHIKSLLSIGNEKESFRKLAEFLKNPLKFFKENKDTEERLLDFMTLMVRLSATISILVDLILAQKPPIVLVIAFSITILLAKIIAQIGLFISSHILNFFVSIIAEKDNLLAAKRIIAYSSSVSLIYPIPIIGFSALFLTIIIHTIGISKQYKLPYFKSFLITALPLIIVGIFAYFLRGIEGLKLFFYQD